jgi:Concanavalin A-like lectin/glucanases superfamily
MVSFNIGSGFTIESGWTLAGGSNSGIVATNLVFNIDAGNASSYPGSGSTVTDTASSISGTFSGSGMTYSSSSGGAFVFPGTGYINFTGASSITSLTNNFSIETWYKSNNNLPKILATGSGSSGLDFGQYNAGGANNTKWKVTKYGVVDIYIGAIPQDTNWHQAVVTYSSTTGTTVYVDGAVSGNDSGTTNLRAGSTNIPVGQAEGGYHNGSISIVRWYNAVLSASDVLQNFNAIRSRYGI